VRNKIIIFFLLFFVQFPLFAQTYSSTTSDKEIYEFLNYITQNEKKHGEESLFQKKRVHYRIDSWDSTNFIRDTSKYESWDSWNYLFKRETAMDSIFSKSDKDYFFQQFLGVKDSVWHKEFSHSKLVKQQVKPNRYYYSVPLFSLDKQYVMVKKEYYCGSLCAYGGVYVYARDGKSGWRLLMVLNSWMS
jgi:hypothetical protein